MNWGGRSRPNSSRRSLYRRGCQGIEPPPVPGTQRQQRLPIPLPKERNRMTAAQGEEVPAALEGRVHREETSFRVADRPAAVAADRDDGLEGGRELAHPGVRGQGARVAVQRRGGGGVAGGRLGP